MAASEWAKICEDHILLKWEAGYWLALLCTIYFFNERFLPCRVPTFRDQKVVNMVVTGVSHSCLLIELVPI